MLNKPNYIRNVAPTPANQKDGEHQYYNPDVKKRTKRETTMNLKSLVKETIKEVVAERKLNMFLEKNTPTNPSKWSYYKSQAKSKFDVYPSAYANAWAAKKYKAAGGGWKKG